MDLVEGGVDLALGQKVVIDHIVEEFGEGGEAVLDFFGVGIIDPVHHFGEVVNNFLKCSGVLLLEDNARVTTINFFAAVDFPGR